MVKSYGPWQAGRMTERVAGKGRRGPNRTSERNGPSPAQRSAMTSAERTVLITGAAARVGRAIALDLAADGWAVAVHYNRSEAAAAALVDAIVGVGGEAVLVRADLGAEAETAALVGAAAQALVGRPLDALVNKPRRSRRTA